MVDKLGLQQHSKHITFILHENDTTMGHQQHPMFPSMDLFLGYGRVLRAATKAARLRAELTAH